MRRHDWKGCIYARSVTNVFLNISQTMLQTFRPATLFKWESNANVFHWILQNFLRTYILQNICKQQLLRKQKVNKLNLVFAKNQQKYNGKHGSVCIFFSKFSCMWDGNYKKAWIQPFKNLRHLKESAKIFQEQ